MWGVDPNLHKANPVEAKLRAKNAYFHYFGNEQLSVAYGIPIDTVNRWVMDWRLEREENEKKMFGQIIEAQADKIKSIVGLSAEVVQAALHHLLTRGTPVSVSEAQMIAQIMERADTLMRLQAGKPTSINQNILDTSPKGFKSLISQIAEIDPYGDYSMAENKKDIIN